MANAPHDRLIILFLGTPTGTVGRWNEHLGWVAEYKDVDGRSYLAKLQPVGWMYC
jgi:hypothetical protein